MWTPPSSPTRRRGSRKSPRSRTQPGRAGRTVEIVDGAVALEGSELRLRPEPGDDPGPWGLWVGAPDSEAGLPAALDLIGKAVAAGSSLVAVAGGTAFTRRLLCEAARLERGTVSLL